MVKHPNPWKSLHRPARTCTDLHRPAPTCTNLRPLPAGVMVLLYAKHKFRLCIYNDLWSILYPGDRRAEERDAVHWSLEATKHSVTDRKGDSQRGRERGECRLLRASRRTGIGCRLHWPSTSVASFSSYTYGISGTHLCFANSPGTTELSARRTEQSS